MVRRFVLPPALLLAALGSSYSVVAQTKPKIQVPAESRAEGRAIVRQLLKEGRIIRSSDVKRGMRGIGRSVFQGTKVEEFTVEVLGVLQRVQGGGDVVLIKVLDGPVVQRQSGIVAGMSGSPVYFNGKMLGAISMTWGFPKEPIGGVTPITQMIEYALPDPTRKKVVSPSGKTSPAPQDATDSITKAEATALEYRPKAPLKVAGRNITRVMVSRDRKRLALSGSPSQATMTMRPATTLLQVSGFSQSNLPRLRQMFEPYGIEPMIGPASKKIGVKAALNPGSSIGVQLVSGDMDQTAVGTVTFRWGNRLLAFGHPMFGQGAASLPMATSFVHEIFPSYQSSFKLASPINVVGALQQDTEFAIGGTVGMKADTIPMSIDLRDSERQIARSFRVQVMKDPVLTPQLIGMVASEAIETTLGLTSDKMVRIGLTMEIDNAPPIVRTNYLYSNNVVTSAALSDLGQSLSITQMNEFARGSIRRVDLDVAVEQVRKTARIKQIFANRNKIKAGETVQINVVMEPTDTPNKPVTRTFQFTVPADAPTGQMRVAAGTAGDYWPLQVRVGGAPPQPTNLQELVAAWGRVGAVNELMVQASTTRTFLKVDRQKVANPAPSWTRLLRGSSSTSIGSFNEIETRSSTTDYSLFGVQFLTIPIEGLKHPDKLAPPTTTPGSTDSTTTTTTTTTTTRTSDLPGGDDSDGSDTDFTTNLGQPKWYTDNYDFDRTFKTPAFLTQIKSLQQMALHPVRHSEAMQVLPGREKPDKPIVPSITSPTPAPTPTPGVTPTPVPTPITPTGSKALVRPAQSWVQSGVTDFLGGDFEQTFATNEGMIRLAPSTKLLATTSEHFGWSITADKQGNTYLGTGSKARIMKINPRGDQSIFYDGLEVAVTALTTDPAGNVYAGVTPGAVVYKFTPDGQRTVFFDSPQTFVWALEWDASGRLLIGTGGEVGRLYRQADTGVKELAHIQQKHVRAISAHGNDIYIGTGDEGVLYRVDSNNGAATALYQAGEGTGKSVTDSEILAVAAAPDGVYFGTSMSGTIYRWNSTNGVIPIYTSPQQAIYALRYVSRGNAPARLYAATGDGGIVYQIEPGRDANDTKIARILEPTQLQALSLAVEPNSNNLLISTGNNAAAYRVALTDTASGTFTSSVFDAKNVVQWGALRVIGQGAVIETRSGNTVDPDTSWSGWKSATANDVGELQIATPAARYLQYRVRLNGPAAPAPGATATPDAATPNLSRLEIIYRTKNNPPSVSFASPRGGEYWNGKKKATWLGKDPDNDTLRYRLWVSSDDGKTWKTVDMEDATQSTSDVDTSKWSEGTYRLKVEASDATRNPDDPQRDEATSLPFTVDNTAPRLEGASVARVSGTAGAGESLRLTANASDALSPIVGVEWRVAKENSNKSSDTPKADASKTTGTTAATGTAGSTPTGTAGVTSTGGASTTATGTSNKTDTKDAKGTDAVTVTPGGKTTASGTTTALSLTSSSDNKSKDEDWQAAAAADGIFDSRREGITALIIPLAEVGTPTTLAGSTTGGTTPTAGRKIEVRVHDAAGNTTTITIPWPT